MAHSEKLVFILPILQGTPYVFQDLNVSIFQGSGSYP